MGVTGALKNTHRHTHTALRLVHTEADSESQQHIHLAANRQTKIHLSCIKHHKTSIKNTGNKKKETTTNQSHSSFLML